MTTSLTNAPWGEGRMLRLDCPDCAGDRVIGICPADPDLLGEDAASIYQAGDMMSCPRCQGRGVIYLEAENE